MTKIDATINSSIVLIIIISTVSVYLLYFHIKQTLANIDNMMTPTSIREIMKS